MIKSAETRKSLGEIFPLIPWAIERLNTDIHPLVLADLGNTAKAMIIHDSVMKEGQRRFEDIDSINIVNSKGLSHFSLSDLLLRLKHGNSRTLRIATNKTVQTLEWTYQLSLDGMEDPRDRLHLVYVPDELWSVIERCVVGYYHGNDVYEYFDIDVEDWYRNRSARVDRFSPAAEIKPLRFIPGEVTLPFEVEDVSN